MPFPPSPMSLPQQPHGGGVTPPPKAPVSPEALIRGQFPAAQGTFDLEEIIRQAGKPKLPKMPLPPPSLGMDEEGRLHPDFELPTQGGMGWPLGSGPDEELPPWMSFDSLKPGLRIPPTPPPGGTLRAPAPWNYEWNPPTPSRLPQMPLPPVDPDKDTLYRGLMPPGERIWQDKPWT